MHGYLLEADEPAAGSEHQKIHEGALLAVEAAQLRRRQELHQADWHRGQGEGSTLEFWDTSWVCGWVKGPGQLLLNRRCVSTACPSAEAHPVLWPATEFLIAGMWHRKLALQHAKQPLTSDTA